MGAPTRAGSIGVSTKSNADSLDRPQCDTRTADRGRVMRGAGIILIALCFLLAAVAYAQQKSSTGAKTAKTAKTAQHTSSSNRLPRSVPDSTTARVAPTSTTATRRELERLEHANSTRSGTVAPRAARPNAGHSVAHRLPAEHNAPINFSYQGPRNGQAGHRTAAPRAH